MVGVGACSPYAASTAGTAQEQCDPPGTCCDSHCKLLSGWKWQGGCKAICGDGVVLGKEECDPAGDGCNDQCRLKTGWKWSQNKATPICGDGLLVGAASWQQFPIAVHHLFDFWACWARSPVTLQEQCDPEGTCCDKHCKLLPGWKWEGGCKAICGDGVIVGEEECDPPNGGECTDTCEKAARLLSLRMSGCGLLAPLGDDGAYSCSSVPSPACLGTDMYYREFDLYWYISWPAGGRTGHSNLR